LARGLNLLSISALPMFSNVLQQKVEDLKCGFPLFGCGMFGLRVDDLEGCSGARRESVRT
jgi:hypothetical protein